jgi:hypothetical protein
MSTVTVTDAGGTLVRSVVGARPKQALVAEIEEVLA